MPEIQDKTHVVRRVYLYGSFADKFGSDPLELAVNSAPLTLLALKSILPGWRDHLRDNSQIVFVISGDDKSNPRGVEAEFIDSQFGDATEVHILPALEGAGIEFAAMLGIQNVFAAFVVNAIGNALVSMVLGSVMQALAPSVSTGAGTRHSANQKQSFIYNGAVNVQEQGGPVPLLYGYFMAGSVVVSSAVDVEQLLTTPVQSIPPANGGGTTQPTSPPAVPWQWVGL